MTGMTVLVVGGGGREHALGIGLAASDSVASVHTAPGNAGTAMIGTNHAISASDIEGLISLAEELDAGLVVVGPEAPLVDGLADSLRAKGIPCFGPHSEGARLEGSKLHAKRLMQSLGVPTGGCIVVESADEIDTALDSFEPPWVVKRDVLAAGKGVTVTSERRQAAEALSFGLESDGFVLLEEYLSGEEASVLVMMDESGYVCLPPSQDHKRVFDGDRGPNTGGMGSYSCSDHLLPFLTDEHVDEARRITERVAEALYKETGEYYKGVMYGGFMLTKNGVKLIEYNARFGDPEAMNVLPMMETDFVSVIEAASEQKLESLDLKFKRLSTVCKYIVPEGYPDNPVKGEKIEIGSVPENVKIFYASVNETEEGLFMSRSRAVAFVGMHEDIYEAERIAENATRSVKGRVFHREDIGTRTLIEKRVNRMKKIMEGS
jgi:phosphoribosylamine--glycine ligase